ncbi:DUF309 domain-containing protein [Hazenella sp. IB182357]|uniref:DUF309 domain-containing protein n=1 Tax=Polycladospora coralii TaxID=2771432 RepID=A0A926N8T2_9BACL|nr:DUF309 domain-containing protein [Polycladospora coralii]MBD1370915.1 DUF309 domain-containing protein [Polycladospora coralii]MBS7529854.1 DUF309 domain-containing protein [Polycladospora coralii]
MSQNYHPLYKAFFENYHAEKYWDAHEVLEELWQTQRENDFYHGLIQIAAIMHQLRRGKVRGARKLAESAKRYLKSYAPVTEGVNVSRILLWLDDCLLRLPHHVERMELIELDQLNIHICDLPHIHAQNPE